MKNANSQGLVTERELEEFWVRYKHFLMYSEDRTQEDAETVVQVYKDALKELPDPYRFRFTQNLDPSRLVSGHDLSFVSTYFMVLDWMFSK